jgi:hypothetical protein
MRGTAGAHLGSSWVVGVGEGRRWCTWLQVRVGSPHAEGLLQGHGRALVPDGPPWFVDEGDGYGLPLEKARIL